MSTMFLAEVNCIAQREFSRLAWHISTVRNCQVASNKTMRCKVSVLRALIRDSFKRYAKFQDCTSSVKIWGNARNAAIALRAYSVCGNGAYSHLLFTFLRHPFCSSCQSLKATGHMRCNRPVFFSRQSKKPSVAMIPRISTAEKSNSPFQ
jgi:hypothetical protein